MAWQKPNYSRRKVDWAGEVISAKPPVWSDDFDLAQEIVNNWRSAHSYPLHAIKMTLKRRARLIDRNAIIAQRLKRLSSIKLKLRLSKESGEHPKLSQMQDVGGCRAVLLSVNKAKQLARQFRSLDKKNPKRGPEYSKIFDYIKNPKANGYRSIHLVYKFRTKSAAHSCYTGQRIEIQIRSRLQHAWATAVETYSTFAGEALKSNIGSPEWIRFFSLMGSAIALREGCPLVPGTPSSKIDLLTELRRLSKRLQVEAVFGSWTTVQQFTEAPSHDLRFADMFLLVLDPNKQTIQVTGYKNTELAKANRHYALLERNSPQLQTVLVSVDSLDALRSAYPNYYLDTTEFLNAMRTAVKDVAPKSRKAVK